MPLPLPAYDGDPTTLQYILDLIANAITDTGGRQFKIRFGTQALTFAPGAGTSNIPTVTHGIGSTSVGVVAFQNGSGGPSVVVGQAQAIGSATFQLYGEFRTGTWAAGGTIPFFWIAVG